MTDPAPSLTLSRRSLLGTGMGTVALQGAVGGAQAQTAVAPPPAPASPAQEGQVAMVLQVNGGERHFTADIRTTLLDALREHLGITGSKKGCDQGQCGACTVHVDGRRVLGCLTLAATVQGRRITTIEGLARGDTLHPMQQAFLDHDAFQCGFCTPGQIMSAVAMVEEGHAQTEEQIREYMSGNLCRCAAYPNIVSAILDGKRKMIPIASKGA